jgi:hypothetical protein
MSPPSIPASLDDQLSLLGAFLDDLKPYLMSPELFWPSGSAGAKSPKLTLGNLLLTMMTIEAGLTSLTAAATSSLHQLQTRWTQASAKWASAISNKAEREMGARLNLWRGYITDLVEGRGMRYLYPTEVRNRVLFELLVPLIQDEQAVHALQKHMASLDAKLSPLTQKAAFQWEPALQGSFSEDAFPFLYQHTTG